MDVVDRLGELLRAAGFADQRANSLRAEGGGIVPPPAALTTLGREEDARLATLLKLFTEGNDLTRRQAEEALAPLHLQELVDAAILEIEGDRVRTCWRLASFRGLVLAGDPQRAESEQSLVMANTLSSTWLAQLTVRRRVGSALDLGTGSGIQALLATRHAADVVGVDLNGHALACARLSQRLSGISDGVSWAQGSWLEPVRGRAFDLVVANPPYVVSPDEDFLYRDSAARSDELSRQVVGDCAAALAEGGFATVMCSWVHREGAWEGPPREWVSGLGCDALLLHTVSHQPLDYAMVWNSGAAETDPAVFDEVVARWVDHYRRLGIDRIATGFVILRRRSADANWIQAFEGVGQPRGRGGEHIERMFDGGDFLHEHRGAGQLMELLSRRWRVLDGHRLRQGTVYEDGAYVGEGRMIREPDMGVHAIVDPAVLPILLGCDGTRSLGELVEQTPIPAGMDRADFHGLCLTATRDLIARGYLIGVEDS